MTRCIACDKTWTGARMEHCPVCHETFSGAEAGDQHRTGLFDVSDGPDRRRCRTPDEMRSYKTKLSKAGFWQSDNGVWHFGHRRVMP